MDPDPIVAEIHRIREKLWLECHGNAEEMAERQRRLQKQHRDRLVDQAEWQRRRQPERKRAGYPPFPLDRPLRFEERLRGEMVCPVNSGGALQ